MLCQRQFVISIFHNTVLELIILILILLLVDELNVLRKKTVLHVNTIIYKNIQRPSFIGLVVYTGHDSKLMQV